MLNKFQKFKLSLFVFFLLFLSSNYSIEAFSLINKNNKFEEMKQNFITNIEKNKFMTYFIKNKIKVN